MPKLWEPTKRTKGAVSSGVGDSFPVRGMVMVKLKKGSTFMVAA